MVYLFRAIGWLLFGSGAIVFIALGGFGAAREGNMLAMAAGVAMPVGMLVTASCTLVANWKNLRSRPAAETLTADAATAATRDKPAKQYSARKLDDQKLSAEAKERVEEEQKKSP
jgi:hypothetical protein